MCHCKPHYFTFCGGGTEFFHIRAIWAEGRLVLWGELWSLPSSFLQFWQQLRDGGYVGGQSMFKSTLTQQYIQALLQNSSCGDSKNNFKGKWTFLEGGDFFDAENTALNDHASLSYKELMWTGLNGVIFFLLIISVDFTENEIGCVIGRSHTENPPPLPLLITCSHFLESN